MINSSRIKTKPFDLEAAKRGEPVITRDGRPARIVCFDCKHEVYPLVVLVKTSDGSLETPLTYTPTGKFHSWAKSPEPEDLRIVVQPNMRWIVYIVDGAGYEQLRVKASEDEAFAIAAHQEKDCKTFITSINLNNYPSE